ncbi:hypothetical protein O9H85_08305 [Paenibacillus filicis]|uniref:Uncharacterized protein n=1 Tax=Paenibacillus gyeongsangnamensis TaxID=3388067 RepID=A0ABT4Q6D4_9BACL|nr:hypothetical protein [Paenibacillus filicis]MCZ8512435.1 hypothetical protein [Paenibacillus filicis]
MDKQSRNRKKKEIKFTCSYIDKYTFEFLGNHPLEFIDKIPLERQFQFKSLVLEIQTGKKQKLVD